MGLTATFSSINPRMKLKMFAVLALLMVTLIISSSFESDVDSWSVQKSKIKNFLDVYVYGDLNSKDISRTPISMELADKAFKPFRLQSFVGNLDISEMAISNYDQIGCKDISYYPDLNRTMESSNPVDLKDDLTVVRRELLKNKKYSKLVTKDDESEMDESAIVAKRWFRFSGASVWLESEQLHLLSSRIVYANGGNRDNPTVSFVRLQLFDKEWKEVFDHRINYLDIDPSEFSGKFDDEEDDSSVADQYSLKFPVTLDIPFEYNDEGEVSLVGPEDPRIIWKDGQNVKEPLLIFNMADKAGDKRSMHVFFPFRKPTKSDPQLLSLRVEDAENKDKEKNWAPFFYHAESEDSAHSRGHIYFIYEMNPLSIIKCSLDYGICKVVQKNSEKANVKGDIRGGTPLVPIPPDLQIKTFSTKGLSNGPKNIWIGFAKIRLEDCGCGDAFYRPALMLLVEEDGKFRKELISSPMDLNMDVLSWDLSGPSCGGRVNVLTPNGISFWEAYGQEDIGGDTLYKDYLALTVSEADANVKVVYLKGVLDYILGMYSSTPVAQVFLEEDAFKRTKKAAQCVLDESFKHCTAYSEAHKYVNP